jgi:hypothetical protein
MRHAVAVNPAESIDVIPLAWQPEAADYSEAFAARNRQRRAVRWFIGVLSVAGAAFAVAAFIAGQTAAVVLGLVAAVGFPLLLPLMVKASTNGLWRMYPALQQPVRMTVDARGLGGEIPVITMNQGAMRITAGATRLDWAHMGKVLETKRVFVVQAAGNDKMFFLVAKRGLADTAQLDQLRSLLVK